MSETQSASVVSEAASASVPEGVGAADQFHTAGIATVGAGHAIHDTFTGFLRPLLPTFIETMVLTKAQAGLLTVFLSWPSLFQPFLGHVADRVSLRPFFILAPTVTGVAMSLLGVAPTYAVLAMLLVVAGVSSASLHAAGPAVIGSLSGGKVGRGMGFWMVGGELGRTLGPLTVAVVVQFVGLRGTPLLMIVGPITSLLLYLSLRHVEEVLPDTENALHWQEVLQGMRPMFIPLIGVTVARSFLVASLSTYLPILLSEQGASLFLVGASLSIFEVAGVVGAFVGGSLSDRWGRRIVLLVSMLATPAFMFVFLAITGWMQYPLLLVLGFTALSITPVFMALMQENFPENRAFATGIFMAMSFLIRSVVVVALGALADRFSTHAAFVVSGFVALAGLPLVFLLPAGGQKAQPVD
jgi:FSR family fosmidomycin resistance protein-like MFS transporter